MSLPVTAVARLLLLLLASVATVTLAARHVEPLPDLVLVVVVAVGLRSGSTGGAAWGLVAGWLVDLMPPGGDVLGAGALLYAAAGALAGRCHRESRVSVAWIAGVGLLCAGTVQGVRVVLALAAGVPVDWASGTLHCVLTATACALLVPVLLGAEQAVARRGLG